MYGCSYVFIYQSDFAVPAPPPPAPPPGAALLPDILEAFVPPPIAEELPSPFPALPSAFVTFDGNILDPLAFRPLDLVEEPPPPFVALPSTFSVGGFLFDELHLILPAIPDEPEAGSKAPAAAVPGAATDLPTLYFLPPALIDELPPPFVALPRSFVTFDGNILDPLAFRPLDLVEEPPPPFVALPRSFVTFDGNILDPLAFRPLDLIEEPPPPFVALPSTFSVGGFLFDELHLVIAPIPDEPEAGSKAPAAAVPAVQESPLLDAELGFVYPQMDEELPGIAAVPPPSLPACEYFDDVLGYVAPWIADELPWDCVRSPIGTWTSYGRPFLYTADNWFGNFFVFETYMRASPGTVYARVYNETDAEPVVGSQLSTIETAHVRQRTPGIFLLDGKEYRSQFAESEPVGTGKRMAAHLIAIRGVAVPIPNTLILGATKDTQIVGNGFLEPDTNYGGAGSWDVGNDAGSLHRVRTLLHYNLGDVPDGATIVECHLVLHEFSLVNSVPAKVHRLTQPNWVELLCTWNIYDSGLPWTTPGGDFTDTDPVNVDWELGPEGFTSLPGLAGLAQDAMNNRGKQLHMLLKIVTESAGVKLVSAHSKDFISVPADQPKLHVSWI